MTTDHYPTPIPTPTTYQIKIIPCNTGNPPGKLAEVEIHFAGGLFDGMKLIGFAIWESRDRSRLNVTFPARQYSVNGERRSFALLRPLTDVGAQNGVREAIVDAWQNYQTAQASDSPTTASSSTPPAGSSTPDYPSDQAARQAQAPTPAACNRFEF